jgi:hypothetical protein
MRPVDAWEVSVIPYITMGKWERKELYDWNLKSGFLHFQRHHFCWIASLIYTCYFKLEIPILFHEKRRKMLDTSGVDSNMIQCQVPLFCYL